MKQQKNICPYHSEFSNFTLWDFNNDQLTYYNAQIIGLIKSMKLCFVLYSSTIKENTKYLKLLSGFNVPFVIILTKIDDWTELEFIQEQEVAWKIIKYLNILNCEAYYKISVKQKYGDLNEIISKITQ